MIPYIECHTEKIVSNVPYYIFFNHKNVKEENFIPCLQELCTSLWRIVCSHHRVALWHQKHSVDSNNTSKTFFSLGTVLILT